MRVATDIPEGLKLAMPDKYEEDLENIVRTFEDLKEAHEIDFQAMQKKVKQLLLKARD